MPAHAEPAFCRETCYSPVPVYQYFQDISMIQRICRILGASLILSLLVLLHSGCGMKGDLYLPEEQEEKKEQKK